MGDGFVGSIVQIIREDKPQTFPKIDTKTTCFEGEMNRAISFIFIIVLYIINTLSFHWLSNVWEEQQFHVNSHW